MKWIFGALVGHDRILKMIKIFKLKEKKYILHTGISHHNYIFLADRIDRHYSLDHSIDHVNRHICHRNDIRLKENIYIEL